MGKVDLYKDYTSTSVLFSGEEKKKTLWSKKYFNRYILPHLPKKKDSNILEIGCGYGRYTKAMIDAGYTNIKGIDISEEQINFAKQELDLNNVFVADALEHLALETARYDCIIIMDVLEHLEIEYCISLLRAINTNLKTKGKLIIHVPNGLAPLKPAYHSDITHVRAFSPFSMSQALRMSGFKSFNHHQLPPLAHGFVSMTRNLIWNCLFKPLIGFYMIISYGSSYGGIYTDNILTVAEKQ